MPLLEDPTVFLADFGVPVVAGGVTGLGILDMPDEYVADGMVISTDYTLKVATATFGRLLYGDAITVDGISYQVRDMTLIEDGVFARVQLQKLAPDALAAGRNPREFGLADLADVDTTGAQAGDVLVNDGAKWVDGADDNGTAVAVALS
jgi:hypothetical protein